MATALRWLPVTSAVLQLLGTALIVWGLKVVSNPYVYMFDTRTQEEIDADKNRPAVAGIAREHEWAVTWGVRLLLAGLALAVVSAVLSRYA